MVAEGNRLCRLQVCEARHHVCGMHLCLFGKYAHQVAQLFVQGIQRVADPKPEIRCHLIVP
jgi:hypothetical protein